MPDLNNSKRLQFKPTHSAVHVDPNSTADSRSAGMVQSGVAMAAQMGGLNIQADELPLLRKSLPKRKGIRRALDVAKSMSQSNSLGANFRYASKMSGVKRQDIAAVAKAVTKVRKDGAIALRNLQPISPPSTSTRYGRWNSFRECAMESTPMADTSSCRD
jgi:hypothetical protein